MSGMTYLADITTTLYKQSSSQNETEVCCEMHYSCSVATSCKYKCTYCIHTVEQTDRQTDRQTTFQHVVQVNTQEKGKAEVETIHIFSLNPIPFCLKFLRMTAAATVQNITHGTYTYCTVHGVHLSGTTSSCLTLPTHVLQE